MFYYRNYQTEGGEGSCLILGQLIWPDLLELLVQGLYLLCSRGQLPPPDILSVNRQVVLHRVVICCG